MTGTPQPGEPGTAQVAIIRCDHCGLRVPPARVQAGADRQFCCSGCEQVFAILHETGLEDFYRLRQAQGVAPIPARVAGRRFQDFDDPSFQDSHVQSTGQGTCRITLYLEGVHCAACVWLVERLPSTTEGIASIRLNLPRARAEVEWDPSRTTLSAVARALDSIGYTPHPVQAGQQARLRQSEDRTLLIRFGVAAACAMNLMLVHFALYAGEHHGIDPAFEGFFRWVGFLLTLPVMLFSAKPFYRAAWAGLRHRVPHIDLPIALAILAAFAYSAASTFQGHGPVWFDSIGALVAALLGARYLQARAQRTALDRTESLRGIAFVEFARLVEDDGATREVPASSLEPGMKVEVRSGEILPADGCVLDGRSSLNNAVLTGEPVPVAIAPGAAVHAGATNLGSRIVIQVEAAGEESRVGVLLRLVDDAMSRKAPIVLAADRWSRWFVTAVLFLAAITAIIWWPTSPAAAMEHVVALLVVTCPCALGIATPIAMTVALSRAANRGIFVKNAGVIQELPRVRTVLLDKTGTLTRGESSVLEHDLEPDLASWVSALEDQSAHPIARALQATLPEPDVALPISEVQEEQGRGIRGVVGGRQVLVGNQAFLEGAGVTVEGPRASRAATMASEGQSPVFVALDGMLAGLILVGDPVRQDAAATVVAILDRGLRPIVISGDHPEVVRAVAASLGIPPQDAHGGMAPEEKRDFVQALLDARDATPARDRILMVGDGVNDAAALALADVGVAIQGGTGASIAASDVVLTRTGMIPVLELAEGARLTLSVIRRNLAFSLCYNLAGAALAMAGIVSPLLAAVLMPTSSLTVILSSSLGRTFGAADGRGGRRKAGRGA